MPVRRTIGAFKEDLREFARLLGTDVASVRRRVAQDIHALVIDRTPRDTGRAQFGWNLSDVAPNTDVPPPGTYSGGGPVGAFSPDPYASAYVVNGVPYITRLEFGHSGQAPQGMVRIALAEVAAEIEATKERLR